MPRRCSHTAPQTTPHHTSPSLDWDRGAIRPNLPTPPPHRATTQQQGSVSVSTRSLPAGPASVVPGQHASRSQPQVAQVPLRQRPLSPRAENVPSIFCSQQDCILYQGSILSKEKPKWYKMQHFSVFLRTYWLNVYVKYNQKKKSFQLFCSLLYTGDCPFKFSLGLSHSCWPPLQNLPAIYDKAQS